MKNRIEQDMTVYDKSNIYEFDNSIMMHYYPKRIVEILEEQGISRQSSCLELGVGHGYSIEYFSNYFQKYVVLDGDPQIVKKFKNEHPNLQIEIIETYFEDFNTDEKYDIVICGFILEHVDNPRIILNKYKKMLKPNGKLFITVPNAEALNRRIGVEAGLLKNAFTLSDHDIRCGHKRYYSMDTLQNDVDNCGLKIIAKEGIFLKPITTSQMLSLNLSKQIIEGMLKVGRNYPQLSLGLLFEVERN